MLLVISFSSSVKHSSEPPRAHKISAVTYFSSSLTVGGNDGIAVGAETGDKGTVAFIVGLTVG